MLTFYIIRFIITANNQNYLNVGYSAYS